MLKIGDRNGCTHFLTKFGKTVHSVLLRGRVCGVSAIQLANCAWHSWLSPTLKNFLLLCSVIGVRIDPILLRGYPCISLNKPSITACHIVQVHILFFTEYLHFHIIQMCVFLGLYLYILIISQIQHTTLCSVNLHACRKKSSLMYTKCLKSSHICISCKKV